MEQSMKRLVFICVGVLINISSLCFAETIFLRDGGIVVGKIVERGAYYTTIKVDGVRQKYYNNKIDRIMADQIEELSLPLSSIDTSLFEELGIPEEKAELIIQFLEVNGTRATMERNINQIIERAPDEREQELRTLFNIDEIIIYLVPVYSKYYSEAELKQLILFYQSQVGQKVLRVNPFIMKEVLDVSIQYFKKKGI